MADAKKLTIRFLNVGQGDSTHLILPNGDHMLVDINLDRKNRGIDVIQYLSDELPSAAKKGEKKPLAYFVATHPHDDHIRGAGALGHDFEIGEMWHSGHELDCEEGENESYDKYNALIEDLGDKAIRVQASAEPWATIGDVEFHVFRPSRYVKLKKTDTAKRAAIHDECMVLKVTYAGVSVLLTGDSHRGAWESIMKHYDKDGLLEARVLHASHHASRTFFKTSKDEDPYTAHLDAIKAEELVISVGAENEHKHPHTEALDLYAKKIKKSKTYRTDEHLTVVLTIDADGTVEWAMDDQDFQAKYELPAPDEEKQEESKRKAAKLLTTAVVSKTRLGDKSPNA